MGRLERRRWEASFESGLARRERRSCQYDTYFPDSLLGREFLFEGEVAADISDAEAAIRRFSQTASALSDTEGIARLLLRMEAVASSRIEGVITGSGRLLRAEAAIAAGEASHDVTAAEILGNVKAMQTAIELAASSRAVAVADVLEIHRELLESTEASRFAGVLRIQQNWIGGNSYNPCGAAYVPPPPEEVGPLLEDLCAFLGQDSLPPLAQAAIAHAQFETIHPFADGNGRTGRALIHVVLKRRGLAPGNVVPISLVLATWSDRYISGLAGFRFEGAPDTPVAHEAVNQWVALFSAASLRAVEEASSYQERIRAIQTGWKERLGRVRAGSALDRLTEVLPGAPVITANSAARLTGRSFPAANNAIERLVEAEVLKPVRIGRRDRAFEAPDLIAAFTDFERRLASPDGDTRTSPPARGAPAKRAGQ